MGIHDFICAVAQGGQNVNKYQLLKTQEEIEEDRKEFCNNNDDPEIENPTEAIIVMIPKTYTKEQIKAMKTTDYYQFEARSDTFSYGDWSFNNVRGYRRYLMGESVADEDQKTYTADEEDNFDDGDDTSEKIDPGKDFIWSSPDYPGYWLLNFTENHYRIFVEQSVSYQLLPLAAFEEILSNREIDIRQSFPSLDKEQMFEMIVNEWDPSKKIDYDQELKNLDINQNSALDSYFTYLDTTKTKREIEIVQNLEVEQDFLEQFQSSKSRLLALLPKYDSNYVNYCIEGYPQYEMNIEGSALTGEKFDQSAPLIVKMRLGSTIYDEFNKIYNRCLATNCFNNRGTDDSLCSSSKLASSERNSGDSYFCKDHRHCYSDQQISLYEEIKPLGTPETIKLLFEERLKELESIIPQVIDSIDNQINKLKELQHDLKINHMPLSVSIWSPLQFRGTQIIKLKY